jgi:RHS repeat-associated protein
MGDTDSLVKNCVIMTEDYYYNTDWKCVEERDSDETCPLKQYVYGIRGRNDLIERDNYLYNSSSGSPSCSSAGKERHYALSDAMGSVTAITSTAGAVVERYSYTAFGQSQVMDKDFADRSMSLYDWQTRFHGEKRDEETGFYNYGYRYYDPVTGRWPSRDPLGDEAFFVNYITGKTKDDIKGLKRERLKNLYGFTENRPIGAVDEFGLRLFDCDRTIWEALIDAVNFPPGGDDNLQHCLSSCKISKACGNNTAKILGTLKEYRDVLLSGGFWVGDIFDPDEGVVDRGANDFVANGIGLSCARLKKDCDCCCEKKAAVK